MFSFCYLEKDFTEPENMVAMIEDWQRNVKYAN